MKSICNAHGIDMSDKSCKDVNAIKLINHITRGECAGKGDAHPGYKTVVRDPTVNGLHAVQLQMGVLLRVIDVASKKQL